MNNGCGACPPKRSVGGGPCEYLYERCTLERIVFVGKGLSSRRNVAKRNDGRGKSLGSKYGGGKKGETLRSGK
jgi:hypothetical protein